jgi:DNA replication protein
VSLDKQLKEAYAQGMLEALHQPGMQLPFFVTRYYRQCGLNECEAMIVLQLMAFRAQGNEFPLVQDMEKQMSVKANVIVQSLQKLLQIGYLLIDENVDEGSGLRSESYNLTPLLLKMFELHAVAQKQNNPNMPPSMKKQPGGQAPTVQDKSVHQMFEEEFGRLLSPMECETISKWLDEEQYAQTLVLHALREAVFSGKLNFRYIDRILLEWQQHKVRTVEQAKEHAANFRGLR